MFLRCDGIADYKFCECCTLFCRRRRKVVYGSFLNKFIILIFRLKQVDAEDNLPGDSQQSLLRNSRNSGYDKPYQPYTQEARKRKQEIYLPDSDDEQSLPNSEGGRAWI